MSGILITFHVLICIFIILAVLLQVGRGAELGAAFGSVGQAQSNRGRATFMSKLTSVMAVLFMVTSFLLTYNTSKLHKTSVLDEVEVETMTPVAPATAVEVAPVAPTEVAPVAEPEAVIPAEAAPAGK